MEYRDYGQLKKRVEDLEEIAQEQQLIIELLFEFCRSVAYKDKLSLMSYQQIYSPTGDSAKKVRMLFKQIRELGQVTN